MSKKPTKPRPEPPLKDAFHVNAQICMSVDVCDLLTDLCVDPAMESSPLCDKPLAMCKDAQAMLVSKTEQAMMPDQTACSLCRSLCTKDASMTSDTCAARCVKVCPR